MEKSFFKDLAVLFKLRLSALVIISSVTGYGMAVESWETHELLCLIIGGILLTGGSNGMNQVWEIELDKLMHRTMNRPLPQDRMTLRMATVLSVLGAVKSVKAEYIYLEDKTREANFFIMPRFMGYNSKDSSDLDGIS